MGNISKQDLNAPRTAADIERKYNFGKSFAEVMGIATDARNYAEEAKQATSNLEGKLTHEEIFNLLTDNGEQPGIYRDANGEIYINAEYIKFDEMNGKSLTLTGKLTNTVKTFFEPGDEEVKEIQYHLLGELQIPTNRIPLYDFNNDGVITEDDLLLAVQAQFGTISLAGWSGAKTTLATLTIDLTNPEKAIHITGKNMWDREVEEHIGIKGTSLRNPEVADFVIEDGEEYEYTDSYDVCHWTYRKWHSGKVECWGTLDLAVSSWEAYDSIFRSVEKASVSYPVSFLEEPMLQVTATSGNTFLIGVATYGYGHSLMQGTPEMRPLRSRTASTACTVTIHLYAVGKCL